MLTAMQTGGSTYIVAQIEDSTTDVVLISRGKGKHAPDIVDPIWKTYFGIECVIPPADRNDCFRRIHVRI